MKNIKHKLKVGALCVMSLVAPKMVTAETAKPKMYKFSMDLFMIFFLFITQNLMCYCVVKS